MIQLKGAFLPLYHGPWYKPPGLSPLMVRGHPKNPKVLSVQIGLGSSAPRTVFLYIFQSFKTNFGCVCNCQGCLPQTSLKCLYEVPVSCVQFSVINESNSLLHLYFNAGFCQIFIKHLPGSVPVRAGAGL